MRRKNIFMVEIVKGGGKREEVLLKRDNMRGISLE